MGSMRSAMGGNLGFGGLPPEVQQILGQQAPPSGVPQQSAYAPAPKPDFAPGSFMEQAYNLSGVTPPQPPQAAPTAPPPQAAPSLWNVPGTWMGQPVTMDQGFNIFAGGNLMGNVGDPGILGEGGAIRFKRPQGGYEHIKTDYQNRPLTYVGGEFIPGRGKYAGPAYDPGFSGSPSVPSAGNLGFGGTPYLGGFSF